MRGMEFCLLGPLVVRREAEEVPIPAARQRVVLAALLLRANQVVPIGELAEALWDEQLPASARATVRNYVKRLRRALGDVDRLRIATRGDGYLIDVADAEQDLARFETLCDQDGQHASPGRGCAGCTSGSWPVTRRWPPRPGAAGRRCRGSCPRRWPISPAGPPNWRR